MSATGRAAAAARADAVPAPGLPAAGGRAGALHLRRRRLDRRAGLGGHPDRWRRRASCPSSSTAGAVGVLLPALLGGVVADRVPQKLILLVVAAVELAGMAVVAALSITDLTELWHLAVVVVRDRRGHGVLLPGLLRVAPGAGPRVRPDGGQRVRGHGAADDRPGDRAGRRRRASSVRSRRAPRSRWPPVGLAGRPARAHDGAADAGTPRDRPRRRRGRARRTRSAPRWPTCARASSTWSARRGCWRRCCSPR